PNTTYHYRVVATSSSGTSNGQDVAFTTQPEPVTDISLSASSVAENQPSGAVVGALSTTLAPPCTYSLVGGAGGSDNASFGLRGGNLALDQDSGLGDTGLAFYSGAGDIWQSFTAGASGQLGRIMLRAVGAPMAGHPMKLRVFDGEGISGAFLGESTATIPPDLLVAWDFSGITLAQGNKYTFQMVEWTFPDFYGFCGWTDDTHYAGGKLNHGGYPGCELGFKTYMAGTTDLVTASTFDYEAKSAYHIRVRAANAASYVEKEFTIHVTGVRDTVTAITSSELETELIYPNPAINGCFINVETNGLLAIYDMRACLVLKKILNNREYVDLTSLAKGVYLVKVNGRTAKLIKK
ncbi:MAG TPA: T9SS type A sorting domain-containing protein, partial [Paludibacter sp.]|nr:T9SS type A sorting domain-containing protein [Paludibacter sp.]